MRCRQEDAETERLAGQRSLCRSRDQFGTEQGCQRGPTLRPRYAHQIGLADRASRQAAGFSGASRHEVTGQVAVRRAAIDAAHAAIARQVQ